MHRSLRRATGPEAQIAVGREQLTTTEGDELLIGRSTTRFDPLS